MIKLTKKRPQNREWYSEKYHSKVESPIVPAGNPPDIRRKFRKGAWGHLTIIIIKVPQV